MRQKSKKEIYENLLNEHRPTIKSFLLEILRIALVNKSGIVVELIRINEETADQLLSKDVKLVPFDPKAQLVKKGMWYNKRKFYPKVQNEKED
jgi:hypothetical protein